jgi:formylglycine-generating enzyme required for sulfatase activity
VSWYAAVSFCRWLSASLSWARGARLPTEEEWEYACRAGTVSLYWSGDAKADLDRVGWYSDNAQGRTHRVGEKPPNDWGLFDVHGNVWEWTASQPSRSYADREDGLTVDPRTFREEPELENPDERRRVVRGGGYWATARRVRAASRDHGHPAFESKGIGFRVCLPLLSVR